MNCNLYLNHKSKIHLLKNLIHGGPLSHLTCQTRLFLASAIHRLPGPKHPAARYYEARRKKRELNNQQTYKSSSNPQRATKRDRLKRKNIYQYQLAQFQFYNQRRKAIRQVFQNDTTSCSIDKDSLHDYFSNIFSTPNYSTRLEYPSKIHPEEIVTNNDLFNCHITKDEIIEATKNIAVDTASGPDHVLVRVIKHPLASEILSLIASRMLKTGFVPSKFHNARTILIHKGGDHDMLHNWRPITICSVLRRVIERTLVKRLYEYVTLNANQRGIIHSPGTHLNTSLLELLLQSI